MFKYILIMVVSSIVFSVLWRAIGVEYSISDVAMLSGVVTLLSMGEDILDLLKKGNR